jgi:hypothetical protein
MDKHSSLSRTLVGSQTQTLDQAVKAWLGQTFVNYGCKKVL